MVYTRIYTSLSSKTKHRRPHVKTFNLSWRRNGECSLTASLVKLKFPSRFAWSSVACWSSQWLFLVPLIGGIGTILSPNWQYISGIYKWYILPIGGLYGTYHLLREPETTIDREFQHTRMLCGYNYPDKKGDKKSGYIDIFAMSLTTEKRPKGSG